LLGRQSELKVPGWAAELGCQSWSELMLKWVLGHPAVTCIIPGTANRDHMLSNCRAGLGPTLDAEQRGRILDHWKKL